MLLVAAIVPLSLSHMHSPELSEPTEHMPLRRMFKLAPLGVVAAFVSGIFIGSFYALAPLYASLTGLSSDDVSWKGHGDGQAYQHPGIHLNEIADPA
ncbi:MAG: hypothetical protein R3301_10645, partial [Saprospiraceae bacterium]|nr:hypothetical protein [Saprospiraceae bacterium]